VALFRPISVDGPMNRQERVANWQIIPNSVVDVLVVTDPVYGEFSYVRVES
jgi:hypothetical protein